MWRLILSFFSAAYNFDLCCLHAPDVNVTLCDRIYCKEKGFLGSPFSVCVCNLPSDWLSVSFIFFSSLHFLFFFFCDPFLDYFPFLSLLIVNWTDALCQPRNISIEGWSISRLTFFPFFCETCFCLWKKIRIKEITNFPFLLTLLIPVYFRKASLRST